MSEIEVMEGDPMSMISAEMSRLKGEIRVLTRERDEARAERDDLREQIQAVQELREAALDKERERTNFWMGQRDKQCDRAIKAETERDELRRLIGARQQPDREGQGDQP